MAAVGAHRAPLQQKRNPNQNLYDHPLTEELTYHANHLSGVDLGGTNVSAVLGDKAGLLGGIALARCGGLKPS
jgi:hypothetical protein